MSHALVHLWVVLRVNVCVDDEILCSTGRGNFASVDYLGSIQCTSSRKGKNCYGWKEKKIAKKQKNKNMTMAQSYLRVNV